MKRDSFGVLFFIKKNFLLKNGEAPVCMRITVNRQRDEVRTKKSINPDLWSQAKECSRARDKKSRDLNEFIDDAKIRLSQLFNEMEQTGKVITPKSLLSKFFGQDEDNRKYLLEVFREHNEQCRQLIGIDYAEITIRKYERSVCILREFIQAKYEKEDLLLKEINSEFVRNFDFYMKTTKHFHPNTILRYMKCFKKVINLAIANEWIARNPFFGIKFHSVETHKEILTMEEINLMHPKISLSQD